MLDHKPNGDCIYLTEKGCGIWETRPQMCREMDCRRIYEGLTFEEARRFPGLNLDVWRKGRELLREAMEELKEKRRKQRDV